MSQWSQHANSTIRFSMHRHTVIGWHLSEIYRQAKCALMMQQPVGENTNTRINVIAKILLA